MVTHRFPRVVKFVFYTNKTQIKFVFVCFKHCECDVLNLERTHTVEDFEGSLKW